MTVVVFPPTYHTKCNVTSLLQIARTELKEMSEQAEFNDQLKTQPIILETSLCREMTVLVLTTKLVIM